MSEAVRGTGDLSRDMWPGGTFPGTGQIVHARPGIARSIEAGIRRAVSLSRYAVWYDFAPTVLPETPDGMTHDTGYLIMLWVKADDNDEVIGDSVLMRGLPTPVDVERVVCEKVCGVATYIALNF